LHYLTTLFDCGGFTVPYRNVMAYNALGRVWEAAVVACA